MTEKLKTLKDLPLFFPRIEGRTMGKSFPTMVSSIQLKAEAIKWFKKGRIDICPRCERGKQSPCEKCNISWQYRYGSFEFEDLLNITSEDLK